MTREEYEQRYAARVREAAPAIATGEFDLEMARIASQSRVDDDEPFDSPEDDADEELQYWCEE